MTFVTGDSDTDDSIATFFDFRSTTIVTITARHNFTVREREVIHQRDDVTPARPLTPEYTERTRK